MRGKRGYTLLELIVVIAILGILGGVASLSIGRVFGTQARKFANEYDALLSQCRVEILAGAGAPCYLRLYKDGRDYRAVLYTGGVEKTSQTLGGGNMECSYISDGFTYAVEDAPLCIGFDRSTGAFLELESVKDGAGAALNSATGHCTDVQISHGGSIFSVILVPSTGYHKVA